jgi:hypothetical protein
MDAPDNTQPAVDLPVVDPVSVDPVVIDPVTIDPVTIDPVVLDQSVVDDGSPGDEGAAASDVLGAAAAAIPAGSLSYTSPAAYPTMSVGPPKAPRSISRLVMAGLTMVTLIGALGLLLNRVATTPPAITPVPVANPASGVITPVSPSPNTVVAPLNQVSFTPGPPQIGADLSAYSGELSESFRPVINVKYSAIVAEPLPWSSHLFGPADLPASLQIPADITGKPLCMVAQINLADLPAMPVVQGNASTLTSLPRAGLLQFWLALDTSVGSSLNLAPSFVETTTNLRQRVTYISAADSAIAPAKRVPSEASCSGSPPAKGPAVSIGMAFSLGWNVPETTDNRFDSSLPTLAGALRAVPADEFYRATGAINSLLGATPAAQFGGFNRLVNQDPRTVLVTFEGESHTGVATDAYEVLFEIHADVDDDERWDIGFGNDGTGGWWADPKEIARLADPAGVVGGRSGIVPSAFWADSQLAPEVSEGDEIG